MHLPQLLISLGLAPRPHLVQKVNKHQQMSSCHLIRSNKPISYTKLMVLPLIRLNQNASLPAVELSDGQSQFSRIISLGVAARAFIGPRPDKVVPGQGSRHIAGEGSLVPGPDQRMGSWDGRPPARTGSPPDRKQPRQALFPTIVKKSFFEDLNLASVYLDCSY